MRAEPAWRSFAFLTIAVAAALFFASCGAAGPVPTAPSPSSDSSPAPGPGAFGQVSAGAVTDFATCLRAPSPPCFSPASGVQALRVGVRALSAPVSLSSTVAGTTVTLTWTAPAGVVSGYVIEAGSSSGSANLASLSTGDAQTTFSTSGVPAGTYFVRVRALDAAQVPGAASNEVVVVVSGGSCVVPGAPAGVTITQNSGGIVALSWTAASGAPTSYILEAGSAPGQANLANADVGATTSFRATGVAAGTYYVRVRARNGCGTGPVSIEVTVAVVLTSGGRSSMSARIDGVPWTANPGFIQVVRTANTIGAEGNDTFTCPIRSVTFAAPRAVGTYALGPVPLGTPLNVSTAALSMLNCPGGQWTAGAFSGSGSITIATLTSNSASGTFAFTLDAQRGTAATGTRTITDGVFNLSF